MEIMHISKTREVLKPRRSLENINCVRVSEVKKCLFGVPDLEDVEVMLEEQIKEDWERIKTRFGIDVEDIENVENERLNGQTPRKRKWAKPGKRGGNLRKKLFVPYERTITDFYQARKSVHLEQKES